MRRSDQRQSAPSASSRFYFRIALLALLLLAFALRIYKLDAQSLWYDEGVSATVARYDLPTLTAWTANDIQPPLYYYLLAGWGRMAGWDEWAVRSLSVFWGVLTVPLMVVLGMALVQNRVAAFLSGLLTTLHPLFVYYSQEARMYTMLIALGILAGYALLKAQQSPHKRWWIVYVIAATAAAYTHYFAFFLLLALAINTLFLPTATLISRFRFYLFGFIPAHLAILVLYSPWFFALFRRLSVDTSYWQGEFKWWEGLRHVAITFTTGETVLENDGLRWLGLFVFVTLIALLALYFRRGWRVVAYSLVWILVPVFCVVTLAWINPKFNARYAMIALPGLTLLWASGVAELQKRLPTKQATLSHWLQWLGIAVFTMLLIFPFTQSIKNWFSDPAFTKAQWREIASYVKQNVKPNERIVLDSGHAWPIWRYYAPDLAAIRLPEIEILDVNAVLNYEDVAQTLKAQLGNANGVWLINWQDEVIDPNQMAATVLRDSGEELPVDAQFWQLRLRHFVGIDSQQIASSPQYSIQTNFDFAGVVKLLGYSQSDNGDLELVWQRGEQIIPPGHDLLLTGQVFTIENVPNSKLAERRPAAYEYPVTRWKPGEIVVGHIPIGDLLEEGELPNTFRLALTLFDPLGDAAALDVISEDGQRIGKAATIGFTIARPLPSQDAPEARTWSEFRTGLYVLGKLSNTQSDFGALLWVDLYWYATQEQASTPFYIAVGDQVEMKRMLQIQDAQRPLPPDSILPANRVLHQRLRLPRVAVGLHSVTILEDPAQKSTPLEIGQVTILQSARNFAIPPLASALNGSDYYALAPNENLSAEPILELLGLVEPIPETVTANTPLSLSLVWRAGSELSNHPTDYAVSLQFLDAAGNLAGQEDITIADGTSSWVEGEVKIQSVELPAPASTGLYRLLAIVYDPNQPGLPRLVTATGIDYFEIATVQVEE